MDSKKLEKTSKEIFEKLKPYTITECFAVLETIKAAIIVAEVVSKVEERKNG